MAADSRFNKILKGGCALLIALPMAVIGYWVGVMVAGPSSRTPDGKLLGSILFTFFVAGPLGALAGGLVPFAVWALKKNYERRLLRDLEDRDLAGAKHEVTAQITLECPNCHKSVKVGGEYAGKETKCPECQGAVRVPASAKDGTNADGA